MSNMTPAQQRRQSTRSRGGEYAPYVRQEPDISVARIDTLVPDATVQRLISTETGIAAAEQQLIGDDIAAELQQSRDFTPHNIRAVTSRIGTQRLNYDPVGAAVLRKALSDMDPESAHYARNILNLRAPTAFQPETPPAPPAPRLPNFKQEPSVPQRNSENPISSHSPEVQNGEVFDAVDYRGHVFHRVRDGVYPMEPKAVRIQSSKPLDDEQLSQVAQMTGYALRTAGQGEGASDPVRDSPYSFIVYNDTTKGGQCNHLDRFQSQLHTIIHQGTPVRKTDRSGPGTKGTRLIDGFGREAPMLEIYYDDVVED